MPNKLALHNAAETLLEAPALAWSSLAWYWGLSFLGMGPRYMEYMQSGEAEIDKAFYEDINNAEINRIPGYERNLTIKQRFDRAVLFYEYCYIQGRSSSLNPPWDYPPDIDTLMALRNRMEAQSQSPDHVIKATTDSILEEDPRYLALWEVGGAMKRDERARDYAAQVKEAMAYVQGEVVPRMQVINTQLDKNSGFLEVGHAPDHIPIDVLDLMDEAMSDDKQWDKLGDVYVEPSISSEKKIITFGIIGRYYNAGHNLETAMWNDDKKRELSGIHHATVRTWHQLMELKNNCKPE